MNPNPQDAFEVLNAYKLAINGYEIHKPALELLEAADLRRIIEAQAQVQRGLTLWAREAQNQSAASEPRIKSLLELQVMYQKATDKLAAEVRDLKQQLVQAKRPKQTRRAKPRPVQHMRTQPVRAALATHLL